MNEVFLIGKIAEKIEYKFMLEKNKTAKAIIKLELLDKTKLELIAYNEIADFCIRKLKENDVITVEGEIEKNAVRVKGVSV